MFACVRAAAAIVWVFVASAVASAMGFGPSTKTLSKDLYLALLGFGYSERAKGETVPVLTVQLGVRGQAIWVPPGTWEIAYQFEEWGLGNFPGTTANLTTSGLILKWTFRY
jgi:hypothetical protein